MMFIKHERIKVLLVVFILSINSAGYGSPDLSPSSTLRVSIHVDDERVTRAVTMVSGERGMAYPIPSPSEFGITTVVFDYGNVFRTFDYNKVVEAVYNRYGIEKKLLGEYFDEREADHSHTFYKYDKGYISKTQAIEEFQSWLSQNSKDPDLILTEQEFDDFQLACWNEPIKETLDMLRAVIEKGYNVKIITTTNLTHYKQTVRDLAQILPNGEEDIYASHAKSFDKRKPDIYQQVVEESGGRPGQYLFIDDVKENIAAAGKAGWQTVLFAPNAIEGSINSIVEVLQLGEFKGRLTAFFYSFYGSEKHEIKVTCNIPGKQGQVLMKVCEISELNDGERAQVLASLKSIQYKIEPALAGDIIQGLSPDRLKREEYLTNRKERVYLTLSDGKLNGMGRLEIEAYIVVRHETSGSEAIAEVICLEEDPTHRDNLNQAIKLFPDEPNLPALLHALSDSLGPDEFTGLVDQFRCYVVLRELINGHKIKLSYGDIKSKILKADKVYGLGSVEILRFISSSLGSSFFSLSYAGAHGDSQARERHLDISQKLNAFRAAQTAYSL